MPILLKYVFAVLLICCHIKGIFAETDEKAKMFQVEVGLLMGPNYGNFSGIEAVRQRDLSDNRYGQSFFTKGFSLGFNWFIGRSFYTVKREDTFLKKLLFNSAFVYTLLIQEQRIKYKEYTECLQYFPSNECSNVQPSFFSKSENLFGLKVESELFRIFDNLVLAGFIGGGIKLRSGIDVDRNVTEIFRNEGYNLDLSGRPGYYVNAGINYDYNFMEIKIGLGFSILLLQNTIEFSKQGLTEITKDWYIPLTLQISF